MNVDPLAGIDAALPGPEAADEKDVFDVTTLRYNLQHVDTIRSVMNIASGCVAGICGLTGWEGLGTCYVINTVGFVIYSFRAVALLFESKEKYVITSTHNFHRCSAVTLYCINFIF